MATKGLQLKRWKGQMGSARYGHLRGTGEHVAAGGRCWTDGVQSTGGGGWGGKGGSWRGRQEPVHEKPHYEAFGLYLEVNRESLKDLARRVT